MKTLMGLTAAMAACAAAPAAALTFQNEEARQGQLARSLFTGVGSLGSELRPGVYGHGCTGSLVRVNVVLTAAHCLGAQRFILPAAGDATGAGDVFNIRSSMTVPRYSGGNTDLALITLDRDAIGYQVYGLYTDQDEVGQIVTVVGAGQTGLFDTGAQASGVDHRLRYGENRYDMTITTLFGGAGDDLLVMDNDNGLEANDLFGRTRGVFDRGVVRDGKIVDTGLVYGDSGGPTMIGNRIAGVHSTIGSGAFVETGRYDQCGIPGSVDDVVAGPAGCSDGSRGDFGVDIRISFYANAINAYIADAAPSDAPEPASWAMMILGAGLIGGTMRRRTPGLRPGLRIA